MDQTNGASIASIRPRPIAFMKNVSASDRAVRKYRNDLIPNRSQALTASIASLQPVQMTVGRLQPSRSVGVLTTDAQSNNFGAALNSGTISRDCFQCTNPEQLAPPIPRSRYVTALVHLADMAHKLLLTHITFSLAGKLSQPGQTSTSSYVLSTARTAD